AGGESERVGRVVAVADGDAERRRAARDRLEPRRVGAEIRAGHDRPRAAVPPFDQRMEDGDADRIAPGDARARHAEQLAAAAGAGLRRTRRVDYRPARAVPVFDQGPGVADPGVVLDPSDRPAALRSRTRDAGEVAPGDPLRVRA